MSTILPSRKVMTTGFLSRGLPLSPLICAVPMTLSSRTRAKVRLSIVQPPRAFKTSRASSGPRHEGVCFHQRWPLDGPRHSASSAKREANGSGSPLPSASAAARSSSITFEVWRSRRRRASRPPARSFACRVPLVFPEACRGQGVGVSSDAIGAAADTSASGFSLAP
jgi:hypothetical protein